ncbi:hypothetical protein V3C99_009190 [Haemonchus contortus]
MSESVGSLLDSYSFSWLAAGYAVAVTNQDEGAAAASGDLPSGSPHYFSLSLSPSPNIHSSDFSTYDTSSIDLSTPYPSGLSSSFDRSDIRNANVTDTSSTMAEETGWFSDHQDLPQSEVGLPSRQHSEKVSFCFPSEQNTGFPSEQNTGCAHGRTRGILKRQHTQCSLCNDLDLINVEADRQALLESHSNQTEVCYHKAKKIRTRKSLEEMDMWQKNWIENVRSSDFSGEAAVSHIVHTWKSLSKTYSTLSGRSSDMQESLKLFVSNAIMLTDLLTVRGYKEVPTLISQFVLHVIGVYMKKPKHLYDLSLPWKQSREILRMVCEIPTNVDTLLSILATLKEANLRFLKTLTSDCIDRDDSFVNLVVSEMNDLESRVLRRNEQLHRREKYGLPF